LSQALYAEDTVPVTSLFTATVAGRAFHSFPTRRSSDLGQHCSPGHDRLRVPCLRLPQLGAQERLGAVVEHRLDLDHQRDLRPVADRKSTRLNSSHSQISYAVFCLKKKNKTTTIYRIQ